MNKKQNKKIKKNKSQAGEKSYEIKLTFSAPFISQASGVMPLGIDAAMQRNRNNIPVINGSLIRGNIRHALEEFQQVLNDQHLKTYIQNWFGNKSRKGSYNPDRANADFDFYWTLDPATPLTTKAQRTRIAIDSNTGTVKTAALQVIEDCFPTGSSNPQFTGKVTLRYKLGNEPKRFEQWIKKALAYIPAMGSFKGVGFGKLIKAEVKEIPAYRSQEQVSLSKETTRFGIQLTLDRPFCLGKPVTPDSNKIVSEELITGSVIKGLIARSYHNNSQKLKDELCFNELIITHALPALANKPQRVPPLPLSLCLQENSVEDMADLGKKELENYNPSEALTFAVDWKPKDFETVNKEQDRQELNLEHIISLKTGIDSKTGVSEENKLFSLECIEPSNHVWCADIDLINLPANKRQAVFQKIQNILKKGLNGIGKTKAQASIKIAPEAFAIGDGTSLSAGSYKVLLVSSARMLSPTLQLSGTNSNTALKSAYQKFWQQVHKDLKLETYFAQQILTSTYYHTQKDIHKTQQPYHPEWMTKEGSVFVISSENSEALDALSECVITGLPPHKEPDRDKPDWKATPFLPENGYGEIQITKQGERQ